MLQTSAIAVPSYSRSPPRRLLLARTGLADLMGISRVHARQLSGLLYLQLFSSGVKGVPVRPIRRPIGSDTGGRETAVAAVGVN